MRKLVSRLLAFTLILGLLAGCNGESVTVRFAVIQNTPGMIFAEELLDGAEGKGGVKYTTNVANLCGIATMSITDGDTDLAILPLEAAVLHYLKYENIKCLAILSGTDVGLISVGDRLNSLSDLSGQRILTQNRDKLEENMLEQLLAKNSFTNEKGISFDYVSGIFEADKMLKDGEAEYLLGTAGLLCGVMAKNSGAEHYGLNKDFKTAFGTDAVGYCLVATEKFAEQNPELTDDIISRVEKAFKNAPERAEELVDAATSLEVLTYPDYGSMLLKSFEPYFYKNEEMVTRTKAYLNVIMDIKAALIGHKQPHDDFYYLKEE